MIKQGTVQEPGALRLLVSIPRSSPAPPSHPNIDAKTATVSGPNLRLQNGASQTNGWCHGGYIHFFHRVHECIYAEAVSLCKDCQTREASSVLIITPASKEEKQQHRKDLGKISSFNFIGINYMFPISLQQELMYMSNLQLPKIIRRCHLWIIIY